MKVTDEGLQKKVTDNYLIEAVNYTDAETRAHELAKEISSGGYTIQDIKSTKIVEPIANSNGDNYYKAKVVTIKLDEAGGKMKPKKIVEYYLAMADICKHALEVAEDFFSDSLVPTEVEAVALTNYSDVILASE